MVYGTSCRLGPPMVVGEARDQLGLIEQLHASLEQRLLYLLYLLVESPLANASLESGHNLSAGCSSREPEGKNSRWTPSGSRTSPPVCHPAWSTTNKTCLSSPAPTSLANSSRASEKSSVFTVGRISQKTFPLWGWTKP